MKAAVNTKYGLPGEVLEIIDVKKPTPKNDEILIRVHASAVNRTDDGFLRAKPWVVRLFAGLTKPKITILGCEFAGEVTETGSLVKDFKKGDRVFGFDDIKWGGHGQYKVIKESKSVTIIPKNISYELAGVSGEGAHYALSYIHTLQKLGAQKVLVHGATGSIGSSAVQLLKQAGFYVVATSTTKNLNLVKSLGADKAIDWQKQDFTKLKENFDVVFDAVGKSSFAACKPVLNKQGVYISTELGKWAQNPLLAIVSPLFKLFNTKRVLFPLPKNNKQIIEFIRDRIADGSFKPVIDKSYSLDKIIDAYKYVETGQKTGNIAIVLP
jgi:NADPH:quinone reductase-like Zn-dependent oxidoreductase